MSNLTERLPNLLHRFTESRPQPATPDAVRVLVVDDEASILGFVDRVLRHAGYQPVTASSGAEALGRLEAMGGCDLLLTDVMMPEMTGYELVRQMRMNTPELKVLYLTGFSDRLFAEKPLLWEDEAYLEKPCSIQGLLEAVSLILYGTLVAPAAAGHAEPAEPKP